MPTLTAKLIDRGSLGGRNGDLRSRLRAFETALHAAQLSSAAVATRTSQSRVKRVRPLAPARANRYHGLKEAIRWGRTRDGGVAIDKNQLDQKFKPWLVQEIGTGQRAVQHVGGKPNPQGRPAKGATYIKTVKSQRGRRISTGLVFATKGGTYSPPGASRGQQLILRSQARGVPSFQSRRDIPAIVISREIKGQHFVRDGAREGFREYRTSALAAARTQLKKKRR